MTINEACGFWGTLVFGIHIPVECWEFLIHRPLPPLIINDIIESLLKKLSTLENLLKKLSMAVCS
jgi:hypothetical protein